MQMGMLRVIEAGVRGFSAGRRGRQWLALAVEFRFLLVGFFEELGIRGYRTQSGPIAFLL